MNAKHDVLASRFQLSSNAMANEKKLREFINWFDVNITGDEKSEAQIFLDRLFQAFGQGGILDVGGKPEFRVRKASQDGGGTSFADYVWKPVVLIEMKKRHTPLRKHFTQAFDYWTRLVPHRPRYVVLCNFDEFWIYDFDTDLDEPKDKIATRDLVDQWGALAFIAPGSPEPVFKMDRVAVTRDAADVLATLLNSLLDRKVDRVLARLFLVQNLIALFAEDIGLLPKYFYTRLLAECSTPARAYDLIGGLFEAMNKPNPATGGRFKDIPYFNGGVFATPAQVELSEHEITLLKKATEYDWSKVQPEIFGALFQDSLDKGVRRKLGAHFTHPVDIMQIVGPTIVQPWREKVEGAKTLTALNEALTRLHNFRVLDPACGSGNFLYVAYRELKRIEARIIERQQQEFKREAKKAAQMQLSFLTAKNFFGIDIHPLAIEIAKVTMVVARKLANDELHFTEASLPFDNLDSNFQAADALLTSRGLPRAWPTVDVIIGNPPFTGAKWLKKARSVDHVNSLRKAYPNVPGMADYCVYWFRMTHDHLPPCTVADPVAGRAGLVGTQNIRHNKSRVGGLDHIVSTGTIIEAVDNQPWSGEANVNVSIVNWVKTHDSRLLPKNRRLWHEGEHDDSIAKMTAAQVGLTFRECAHINSSLTDATDVSGAARLKCNYSPQRVFQGITPGHDGFVLNSAQKEALLKKDPGSASIVFPYLVGRELTNGDGNPKRFLIDFGSRTVLEAQKYTEAFAQIKSKVLPDRKKKAEEGKDVSGKMRPHHKQFLEHWWRLTWDREDMKQAISTLQNRYIASSRTQRWPFIFTFIRKGVLPGDKLQTFAFDDDYSFGILQASTHLQWYAAKAARLKNEVDYNYSTESVFDTYPWPQEPTPKQVESIATAAVEIRKIRTASMPIDGGLRRLYGTLLLPGANPLKDAHRELDDAVLNAYGFSKKKDLLEQILDLNGAVAADMKKGAPVNGPGIPANYTNRGKLVTRDCMG